MIPKADFMDAGIMIEIEKGIPMPARKYFGRNPIYPFREMKIGDSFFAKSLGCRVRASKFGKQTGRKFESRVENKGFRVWRTA